MKTALSLWIWGLLGALFSGFACLLAWVAIEALFNFHVGR